MCLYLFKQIKVFSLSVQVREPSRELVVLQFLYKGKQTLVYRWLITSRWRTGTYSENHKDAKSVLEKKTVDLMVVVRDLIWNLEVV